MPNLSINSETMIGIALIVIGTFTFAKGTSQYITQDTCLKSVKHVSNLVNTVNAANGINKHVIDRMNIK